MSPEENEAESPAVRDEPSEGRQSGRKPWPPEHWPPEARDLVIRSGMSPAQVEAWWAEGPKRNLPPDYAEFIAWDARSAPIGYRDFYLCLGEEAKQEARAAFLESVASVAQLGPGYRLNGETAKRLFGNRARTFKSVPIAWVHH